MTTTPSNAEAAPASPYRDAEASLLVAGKRASYARWLRLAATLPTAIFVICIMLPPLNHDVAAVLDFSRRWLAGETLYVDLIDVNPPLVFILNLVPAALARWTILSQSQAMVVCLLALAFLFWRLIEALRRDRPEGPVEAAVLTVALPFIVVAAGSDFGQRDVMMAVAGIPYCLLAARRIDGQPTSLRLTLLVTVLAAVGFALKPHFLGVPVLVEGLVLLRRGPVAMRRDPVPWVMLGIWLAYLVSIPLLFPAYVNQVVPMAWKFYADIHGPGRWRVLVTDMMGAAEALLFLAVPLGLRRDAGAFGQALALSAVGAFMAAWVQHKGWTYHVMPMTLFGLAALAVSASRWMDRTMPEGRARASAPALALIAVAGLFAYQLRGGETPWREFTFEDETAGQLTNWLERVARGQQVLVLTPDIFPVYPALTYADAHQTLNAMSTWLLQGFYRNCPAGAVPYRPPSAMRRSEFAVYQTVAENFAANPPVALVVSREAHIPSCRGRFDLLAYFARNPLFGETLERYAPAGEIGNYRLFLRKY